MAALGPYVPFEHWPDSTRESMAVAYSDKAAAAAARIRESMRRARCTCTRPGELADDGRCSRCWGWPGGSA
jgi:hypothetical protein